MFSLSLPWKKGIKLLIFDLDGTLVNSFGAIHDSLTHAMNALGRPPWNLETTKRHVGWGLAHLIACAVGDELVEQGVGLFRQHYAQHFLEKTHLLSGVGPVLHQMHQEGFTLAIASNKPSRFTREIMKHFKLHQLFHSILGPEDVSHPKPHPEMLEKITQSAGISTKETLYVGDMPLDLETAKNAGVEAVLVATGVYAFRELKSLHPWVFTNLSQFWKALGGKDGQFP